MTSQEAPSLDCKLKKQTATTDPTPKIRSLGRMKNKLGTHSMSIPEAVSLWGSDLNKLCKKNPSHIYWKMESLSKNTREGTETFQRRQGSEKETKRGRQNSTYKKKRNGNWIFLQRKKSRSFPCSLTTPTKKGKNSQWETALRKISLCTTLQLRIQATCKVGQILD